MHFHWGAVAAILAVGIVSTYGMMSDDMVDAIAAAIKTKFQK